MAKLIQTLFPAEPWGRVSLEGVELRAAPLYSGVTQLLDRSLFQFSVLEACLSTNSEDDNY